MAPNITPDENKNRKLRGPVLMRSELGDQTSTYDQRLL